MSPRPPNPDKRARILQAATVVFAERGFRNASVREICARAGANIAAVTYYFGGKQRLYTQAVMAAHQSVMAAAPMPRLAEFATPAEALRAWLRWGLRLVIDRQPEHVALNTIALREMRDPSPALGAIVHDAANPVRNEVVRILRALKPTATDDSLLRLANFVLIFAMQFEHSGPLLERLGQPAPRTERELDLLVDEAVNLLLHGLTTPAATSASEAAP